MPEVAEPEAGFPIVEEDGSATDEMQRWMNDVTRLDLIIGTGSPEGNIEATVGRQYMDDSGSTGSILYIKKLADIGGDRTQGWIIV